MNSRSAEGSFAFSQTVQEGERRRPSVPTEQAIGLCGKRTAYLFTTVIPLLMFLKDRISWSEVIDNFVSVKKLQKTSGMTSMSSLLSQSSLLTSTSSEESKKIFTPKVRVVTRKRPISSKEEKEKRSRDEKKRRLMEEENQRCLQRNTDNLQMMKNHLEKIKQKMKEMKEKKKLKKKV